MIFKFESLINKQQYEIPYELKDILDECKSGYIDAYLSKLISIRLENGEDRKKAIKEFAKARRIFVEGHGCPRSCESCAVREECGADINKIDSVIKFDDLDKLERQLNIKPCALKMEGYNVAYGKTDPEIIRAAIHYIDYSMTQKWFRLH